MLAMTGQSREARLVDRIVLLSRLLLPLGFGLFCAAYFMDIYFDPPAHIIKPDNYIVEEIMEKRIAL